LNKIEYDYSSNNGTFYSHNSMGEEDDLKHQIKPNSAKLNH